MEPVSEVCANPRFPCVAGTVVQLRSERGNWICCTNRPRQMSWETRRGSKRPYYYRAQRVNGRVKKICYGSGTKAAAAARQDAEARAARTADASTALALETELAPLNDRMRQLDEEVDLLMEAVLMTANYYERHGAWRRRRGPTKTPSQAGSQSQT